MALSGPLFDKGDEFWRQVHDGGGHYNTFSLRESRYGMKALREFFPDGPDDLNFVLFSTSGIHGSYITIEENEAEREKDASWEAETTFVIVQPRLCTIRYGNCSPETKEDFEFLKDLRQRSWDVVQTIGKHTPNED